MAVYNQTTGMLDIRLILGDYLSINLILLDNNYPIDLTGYTLVCETEVSKQTFTITPVDITKGQFTISLTSAQTIKLQVLERWTLVLYNPSGDKSTILAGIIRTD